LGFDTVQKPCLKEHSIAKHQTCKLEIHVRGFTKQRPQLISLQRRGEHRAGMYAGPDAMDWEDDVDMYGGASSTSAAVIVDPETPSGPTEKKQEARRMKEQAASDRWEHMTA